ncbi:hypothetical protein FKP32DRAFT_1605297 [Trametes sanguinea]|nr:hypothetical protein FKP32DRAFT_1605297 [Trametes sanguinea]
MAVPPAPELPGDALLEIFIHPASLPPNRPLDPGSKFSDGIRLKTLGKPMVECAYHDVMQAQWPRSTPAELTGLVNSTIGGFMQKAVHAYRWMDAVRGRPSNIDPESREILAPIGLTRYHQEAERIFYTYAGAVHVEYGYGRLRAWIASLIHI